ncbi:MAG TPA: tRNA (cytidine(34)-2'-O)-methyltransferase [Steroidobacteraceae bacterium]|nr:tRNA (cytidine(34)-2'-O)-methyltransferase [Steroidobacteraceae bacterium]
MFDIILLEPEIPPNTGNVIRLCANTGSRLHLVHPLGFSIDDAQLRRAGLDYHQMVRVRDYPDLAACLTSLAPPRLYAVETGGARRYSDVRYQPGDAFLFGRETSGLSRSVLDSLGSEALVSIPMQPGNRSINLSNAVALVIYEAWRQNGFMLEVDP